MAAKKVKTTLKLNLPAGQATPAPPTGPALGQHGVNIMDFVNAYNKETAEQRGQTIPAVVTIYQDRSFDFVTKLPPVSALIKQELNLDKGASEVKKEVVGTLTQTQVEKIAKKKMPDLNTTKLESAKNTVIGTAKSMGVEIK